MFDKRTHRNDIGHSKVANFPGDLRCVDFNTLEIRSLGPAFDH